MRVAITHDWLVEVGGAERLLGQLLQLYPGADVFTTVDFLRGSQRGFLGGARVHTTFLQGFPAARRNHWRVLPLMPLAMEQFDLSGYDLVISLSHSVAKGVLLAPEQVHVSYVISPLRCAWERQGEYLRWYSLETGIKGALARGVLHWLRGWDHASSARPDAMLAVSRHTARRVETCYRREAEVLHPPVEVEFWTPGIEEERGHCYLAASRLVPSKRMDVVVDAFTSTPERRLTIVGEGPELNRLRAKAGPNISFVGWQPDEVLRDYLRRARAFVHPAREEFGMGMVEALACGAPVIALGRAGALETVRGLGRQSPTGVFFEEQSAAAVVAAVDLFEAESAQIDPVACRDSVLRFAPDTFRARFAARVQAAVEDYELPTEFGPSAPQLLLAPPMNETPLALALSGK